MNCLILTEGDNKIGFGHITRCLSIYQALIFRGLETKIIIKGDENVNSILRNINYEIYNWIDNIQDINLLDNVDLLIIDSYLAPVNYLISLAGKVKLISYLDDSKRINCDLSNVVIIDWNLFVEEDYFIKNSQTKYLLGNNYIALRQAFWKVPDKIIKDQVTEILITFGGNDLRNLSPIVLDMLLTGKYLHIHKKAVIGKGVINLAQFAKYNDEPTITLLYALDENQMIECFFEADIVVSAAGQTLFELARIGVPTVAVAVIENQAADITGWIRSGFIEYAGEWNEKNIYQNILACIDKLMSCKTIRENKKETGRLFVDGKGTNKIVDFLLRELSKQK